MFTIQVLRNELDAILELEKVKLFKSHSSGSEPIYLIGVDGYLLSIQVVMDIKYPFIINYKDSKQ